MGTSRVRSTSAAFRPFLDSLASLLAPGTCRLCDGPLLRLNSFPVCEECLAALADQPLAGVCDICSEPLGMESASSAGFSRTAVPRCAGCVAQRPKFVRATAYGSYDELRSAIHLLKFEGQPALAKPLSRMLAQAILLHRADAPQELTVVPVPLFRRKRSYNQSALLAEHALTHLRTLAPAWQLFLNTKLLHRVSQTESQFLLSIAQRRENVRGAFAVHGSLHGMHVLLVDDVYTTGATAAECTRVLLAAGAASVRVATLARAGRDLAVRWRPPPLESRPLQSAPYETRTHQNG